MTAATRSNWLTPLLALLLAVPAGVPAAEVSPAAVQRNQLISFAFATWMGTGFYRVADRQVAVLNLPLYYPLRVAEGERWGVKLRLPVAIGSYRYEDLPLDLQTFTFVPGVELDMPLGDRWRLRPFLQAGFGRDFDDGGDRALIYGAGFNTLGAYRFKRFDLLLGGGLLLASSDLVRDGEPLGFSKLDLGTSLRFPAGFNLWQRPAELELFLVGSNIVNRATLPLAEGRAERLRNLVELGVSLGSRERARIGRFPIPRLGLSYVDGDHLQGVKLNFGFPF